VSTSTTSTIAGSVIIVALIGAVGAMAFKGTITGLDALGFLAPLATLAGGIVAHAMGVNAGSTAAASGAAAATLSPAGKN
jgi:hypothetical protein